MNITTAPFYMKSKPNCYDNKKHMVWIGHFEYKIIQYENKCLRECSGTSPRIHDPWLAEWVSSGKEVKWLERTTCKRCHATKHYQREIDVFVMIISKSWHSFWIVFKGCKSMGIPCEIIILENISNRWSLLVFFWFNVLRWSCGQGSSSAPENQFSDMFTFHEGRNDNFNRIFHFF